MGWKDSRASEIFNPLRLEAVIIGNGDYGQLSISDLRLWERGPDEPWNDGVQRDLRDRRLDGHEPGLIGYWMLAEGEGTRIEDSSRYAHHGTLTDGAWVGAPQSNLTLDRTLEDLRGLRTDARDAMVKQAVLGKAVAQLDQTKQRLTTHIAQLTAGRTAEGERFQREWQAQKTQLQELENNYSAWMRDIEDGGKVAVSTFSNTIAQEIDRVTQDLNAAQSPYSLQGVALEVKALPVAGEDDTGMRLRFPAMDDQKIQSDQLSTLRMSFATRSGVPVRPRAAVPDVRGYTDSLARHRLGSAGFRVQVLDQAAISEEEIGRVVNQVPSPDVLAEPDKVVRVFVGRPSGMSAPEKETQG